LTLKCNTHGNKTEVCEPKDFDKVPEGGCKEKCEMRLECGHACESTCHNWFTTSADPTGHKKTKCIKDCQKERKCGHKCKKRCFQCIKGHEDDCKFKVDLHYKCGHIN